MRVLLAMGGKKPPERMCSASDGFCVLSAKVVCRSWALLHASGHALRHEDERDGKDRKDCRSHEAQGVGTRRVEEVRAQLGANESTHAVADEDQAVVTVVVLRAEDHADHRREHHEQAAEGEADERDAHDEERKRVRLREHEHGYAVDDHDEDQALPALEDVVDEAEADATDHVRERHDGHAEGCHHGRLADLALRDGARERDHHGAGGVGEDEHQQQDPEHFGAAHLAHGVVARLECLGLLVRRLPALGQPTVRARDNHPCDSAHADKEHDAKDVAGHLRAVRADKPLGDGAHEEGATRGASLHEAGDGAGTVREPLERRRQACRVDHAAARACEQTVEDVELRDARGEPGEEPTACEERQAHVDRHAGAQFLGERTADEADSTVREHVDGIGKCEVRVAPAELRGQRDAEQAEICGGRGEQALDPHAGEHAPARRLGDSGRGHGFNLPFSLRLQRTEVERDVAAVELAGGATRAEPVHHVGDVLDVQERHTLVHLVVVLEALTGELIDELHVVVRLAHGRLHLGGAQRIHDDALVADLFCKRLGEAEHTPLGHAVGRELGRAVQAARGRDVDDAAEALLEHVLSSVLVGAPGADKVDVDDLIDLLVRELPGVAEVDDAGVRHDNVQATERLPGAGEEVFHVGRAADVRADGEHASASRFELGHGLAEVLVLGVEHVCQHDVETVFCELQTVGLALTGGTAGDKDDLAILCHSLFLPLATSRPALRDGSFRERMLGVQRALRSSINLVDFRALLGAAARAQASPRCS